MVKNIILIPVYNDWKCLNHLIAKINKIKINYLEFIIINDFSTKQNIIINKNKVKITVLNLKKNIGSQGCLAVGLKYIQNNYSNSNIILMDSDGEDNPLIINYLINLSKILPNKIITVNRTTRTENIFFKILYEINLIFTTILTLKYIRFGNFSLLNFKNLKKIFSNNDIWCAYPASIVNNFSSIKKVYARKEVRYFGKSKMNYFKLFLHSLKILSVFRKRIILISLLYLLIFFYLFTVPLFIFFVLIILILNLVINILHLNLIKSKPKNYLDLIKNIKYY
jgi:hypothetical protein